MKSILTLMKQVRSKKHSSLTIYKTGKYSDQMKKVKRRNQKSKLTGRMKTQQMISTARASLKSKFKVKQARRLRLSHMISQSYQWSHVLTVASTNISALFNARPRTATSGFVMERVQMSLAVTFSGIWSSQTIKRLWFTRIQT